MSFSHYAFIIGSSKPFQLIAEVRFGRTMPHVHIVVISPFSLTQAFIEASPQETFDELVGKVIETPAWNSTVTECKVTMATTLAVL